MLVHNGIHNKVFKALSLIALYMDCDRVSMVHISDMERCGGNEVELSQPLTVSL